MILALLLSTLESIINRALQSDPSALAKISAIKNQTVEIHCIDWKIKFTIICGARELSFEKKYLGEINTIVSGTLNNFLSIFVKGGDTTAVFQYPIDISGNTHNIEVLRDAFKNIDLDWEEKLSHFLGDTVAHKICFHALTAKKTLENTAEKLSTQAKEYIHFEGKNLPTKKQVEKFYLDVATLRDDVDRTAARVLQLERARDSA